jgi:hypothetical protein
MTNQYYTTMTMMKHWNIQILDVLKWHQDEFVVRVAVSTWTVIDSYNASASGTKCLCSEANTFMTIIIPWGWGIGLQKLGISHES